jgi:hypothetical protein
MADDANSGQGWRYQHNGSLGSKALVVLADGMVRTLQAHKVPLAPKNRADAALDIIWKSHERTLQVANDDPGTNAVVADAIRDAWEFLLIARTLPAERDPDLDGKLKVMLHGSRRSHKPRDYQFELLTGALFGMVGIKAWRDDPDLRFGLTGQEWGLAAKRIRSGNQLAPSTKKAREQIEQAGLRGYIAVNVDAFLGAVQPTGDPAIVGQAVDAGVDRLDRLLPEMASQRSLLGIMMIGAIAGWTFEGDLPRISHPLIFKGRSFGKNHEDLAAADELFNRLESGLNEGVSQIHREIAEAMEK